MLASPGQQCSARFSPGKKSNRTGPGTTCKPESVLEPDSWATVCPVIQGLRLGVSYKLGPTPEPGAGSVRKISTEVDTQKI